MKGPAQTQIYESNRKRDMMNSLFHTEKDVTIINGNRYLPPSLGVVEKGSGKQELLLITQKNL